MPALVRMNRIVKRFGDVVASDEVSLELSSGEVHALLGENGAGKTTLMNMLYGLMRPDAGTIELDERPIAPRSPTEAIAHGIGMVHQHPQLVGALTLAENLRLAGLGDGSAGDMRAAIAGVTRTFSLEVDPHTRIDTLPMSLRQRIEIVRCLAQGVRVLILDEPTAVLTPAEVQPLFGEVRTLAQDGRSVIFITHKLAEVSQIAHKVTVLRQGRNVGTFAAGAVSTDELTQRMVGRALGAPPDRRPAPRAAKQPVIELEGCGVCDEFGHVELADISLGASAGEIVCLAGVEGNGQRPLTDLLFGLRTPTMGTVRFEGQPIPALRQWRSRRIAIARIPEDRQREGLVLDAPLWRNLLTGPLAPRPRALLSRRALVRQARGTLEEYGVIPADPWALARSLSGGNQQKVVLARELSGEPRALVAVNPTRGLDVGAQRDVYRRLDGLRERGVAVLVISADLDEVERLADRIGVLYRGVLHGPFDRAQAGRGQIGRIMAGTDDAAVDPQTAPKSFVRQEQALL